jgi:DNA sulfur modification protein DndD
MPWRHISLTRLEVTNFKRFYGSHTLELASRPDLGQPLILIGGDNGRGKTSIHEAINYALYEDDDLPGIHTRPTYRRAVSDRLNRRALDEGSTDYAVAIEIVAQDTGPARNIRIERRWIPNLTTRNVADIKLQIFENGRPVDFIEDSPSAYQDFLRTLLPPRIAPFFFFDGERIQDFADEDNDGRKMVEAIEDILHITVYKSLREDLRKYVVDHVEKTEIRTTVDDGLFGFMGERERIQNDLLAKQARIADLDHDEEQLRRDQLQIEHEIRRVASPHATERDELIAERSRIQKELEDAKGDLESAFRPLPVLLAGQLRYELAETLKREETGTSSAERIHHLRLQLKELRKRVFLDPCPRPSPELSLSPTQAMHYAQLHEQAANDIFGLNEVSVRAPLHDVGEAARRRISERLDQVREMGSLLVDAMQRRERLGNELRAVENKLQSTSDDPHVAELIQTNNSIAIELGRLQQERRTLEGEVQRLQADLAIRNRQIEDRQEKRKVTDVARRKVKLARDAQRVLDEFIKRLAPEKLALLRDHMDEMYNTIKKPEDPARDIEIDPETWQVVLKDERGRPLEKRVFSAGMREMYALSLLWALSKASGRELPIVIDTPVGRLDTTNRRTIFERYLPKAGHQVIVLSTDSEVDVNWAKRLAPYVARQYRLDYDSATDSTVIRPGYFF